MLLHVVVGVVACRWVLWREQKSVVPVVLAMKNGCSRLAWHGHMLSQNVVCQPQTTDLQVASCQAGLTAAVYVTVACMVDLCQLGILDALGCALGTAVAVC